MTRKPVDWGRSPEEQRSADASARAHQLTKVARASRKPEDHAAARLAHIVAARLAPSGSATRKMHLKTQAIHKANIGTVHHGKKGGEFVVTSSGHKRYV